MILSYLTLIVITILLNLISHQIFVRRLKEENKKIVKEQYNQTKIIEQLFSELESMNLSCSQKLQNIQQSQHHIWSHLQKLEKISSKPNINQPLRTPKEVSKSENKIDKYSSRNESIVFKQESVLLGHTKLINTFAISSNLLASASDDGTVRLWGLDTRKEIFSFFESQEIKDISINMEFKRIT